MTLITVQIESEFRLPPNIIFTNIPTVKKLELPLNRPVRLSFGNKSIDVFIRLDQAKGNIIRIPKSTAEHLCLQDGIQIHAKYNKKTELCLGPILGVLVHSVKSKDTKNPFGKLTTFANEVAETAYKNGVYPYFFTFEGVNTEKEYVEGWTSINNKWVKKIFPIPNIIYNRISSRKLEKKLLPKIKTLQLKYKFVFFNNNFLNKWEVYRILKDTSSRNVMPKTILFQGSSSIKTLLNFYNPIYLKPTNGSLGIGIIKIEKKHRKYIVRCSHTQGPTIKHFNSYKEMYKYLLPRISAKKYIVQQGLYLINQTGRPIDFRILVQKDSVGKWSVTSMVARIAKEQYFVSNIAQGGTQSKIMKAIKEAEPNLAKKLTHSEFRNLALKIAKDLESASPNHFAELGIDLALDKSGKLWLLEVNSKPSKIDEQRTSTETRPSVFKLINYVKYITGFSYPRKIIKNTKSQFKKN